jgi:DNA-binding Lrp family transcriptional regulator
MKGNAMRGEGLADLDLVRATQAGLPLVPAPFAEVARRLGVAEEAVLARFRAMLADGRVRRIAAVPNHYRLGYRANGMSVWDVEDDSLTRLGPAVGALDCVSHCYRRPRRAGWPYNLFAMVHGHDRAEVAAKVARIAALLGDAARAHEVLYSRRILKKSGLRLA